MKKTKKQSKIKKLPLLYVAALALGIAGLHAMGPVTKTNQLAEVKAAVSAPASQSTDAQATPTPAAETSVPASAPVVSPKQATVKKSTAVTPKQPAVTSDSTPASVTPTGSDIATEAICPGQNNVINTTTVLTCMTAYARTQHGMKAVTASVSLTASAAAKAQDMASCGYSHTACDHDFNYWMPLNGFTGSCNAENIAKGQKTPGEVFVAWMNSTGHRENILNPNYDVIGNAVITMTGGPGWVMHLGGC